MKTILAPIGVMAGVVTVLACMGTALIAQQSATVPFELYENIPFVQVRINGSLLSFLVDSGADTCLIDARRAASLNLNVRGQARGTGFGDGQVSIAFDSAAARAGLQAGDVIVAIDGTPASTFTLDQIRAMFRRHGRRYSVTLERAGTTLDVSLELSRVI